MRTRVHTREDYNLKGNLSLDEREDGDDNSSKACKFDDHCSSLTHILYPMPHSFSSFSHFIWNLF